MTEAEWLACADPEAMLDWLAGKVSDRKLRLFAVACCYLSNRDQCEEPYTSMYESVVRYVDGRGTLGEVRRLWKPEHDTSASLTWPERVYEWGRDFATIAAQQQTNPRADCAHFPNVAELRQLIDEVFGNPFRPVTFPPEWRTDTAVLLARQMYESDEFSAMPILADALQDAGCDAEDILAHCRDGNRSHVRGCWAVDLVLGQE